MKWGNVSEDDLSSALAAIVHGNGHEPVAARSLIEYFYERIDSGMAFDQQVLTSFLHHAFGKIINDGWSADQAFGFKPKKGKHKRESTYERDLIAAAYVILFMRRKKTYLEARGAAAELLFPKDKGDKAVEKAYSTYKDGLGILPDEALIGMLPLGGPVISPR